MSLSSEERISQLEKRVEKHSFQIRILQKLAANYDMFGVFDQILAYDLGEDEFNELQNLTRMYEEKLDNNEVITLEEFTSKFTNIIDRSGLLQNRSQSEVNTFIKLWLNGPTGGIGFSKGLYEYFNTSN
ncbi:hypothetical protein ACQKMV_21495 [Lysinibacillus sp. NPDC094403]|uniref:hypothetical protein n=1 Tax=Lysinibacillus sp. NPDC094403 TaxID=3390581 RepID=UPI003D05B15E